MTDENDNLYNSETQKFIVNIYTEGQIKQQFIAERAIAVKLMKQARRPRFLRGFWKSGAIDPRSSKENWAQVDLKRAILIEVNEITQSEINAGKTGPNEGNS